MIRLLKSMHWLTRNSQYRKRFIADFSETDEEYSSMIHGHYSAVCHIPRPIQQWKVIMRRNVFDNHNHFNIDSEQTKMNRSRERHSSSECGEARKIDAAVVYRLSARPNAIYLNITNRCSNSCRFCFKNFSVGLSGYGLWLDREPSIDEIWSSLVDEVRISDVEAVWCGFGEPSIRLDDILDLTRRIRKRYPDLKVRLDTDGLAQLRNKERAVARELKDAGIDSVSISLNAESEGKYVELCRPSLFGSYQAVLDFARDCKKYFSQVMLTVVNFGDIDTCKCKEIAQALGCDFRVRGSRQTQSKAGARAA